MSLHLTITGSQTRPFLQLLSSLCKVANEVPVFFVARDECLEVSVLSGTQAVHVLATVPRALFARYHYTRPAEGRGGDAVYSPHERPQTEMFFSLHSKTLTATVLRNAFNTSSLISRIDIDYDTEKKEAREKNTEDNTSYVKETDSSHPLDTATPHHVDVDTVTWVFMLQNRCTKTYRLRLMEAHPQWVQANTSDYHFEIAADPKFWGSLLFSLPPAQRCVLAPLDGRLELRCVEARLPLPGEHRDSSESNTAAVITANPSHFHWFRYYNPPDRREITESTSAVAPSGEETVKEGEEGEESVPFLVLPGKITDVKPLRVAAHLAGQLGLTVVLQCGVPGTPVRVCSLTSAETLERKTLHQQREDPTKSNRGSIHAQALFTANQNPSVNGGASSEIQFVMHIAAEDHTPPEPAPHIGEGRASESFTVASGRASESFLPTPRHTHPEKKSSTLPSVSATPAAAPLVRNSLSAMVAASDRFEASPHTPTQSGRRRMEESHVTGSPTGSRVADEDSGVPPTPIAATTTSVTTAPPPPPSGHSLRELFPLDFEAFANGGYLQNGAKLSEIMADDEEGEEEDEEIKQFLESCVRSMNSNSAGQ